jgi:hypothetical protein
MTNYFSPQLQQLYINNYTFTLCNCNGAWLKIRENIPQGNILVNDNCTFNKIEKKKWNEEKPKMTNVICELFLDSTHKKLFSQMAMKNLNVLSNKIRTNFFTAFPLKKIKKITLFLLRRFSFNLGSFPSVLFRLFYPGHEMFSQVWVLRPSSGGSARELFRTVASKIPFTLMIKYLLLIENL